jgi:hypothetical protein
VRPVTSYVLFSGKYVAKIRILLKYFIGWLQHQRSTIVPFASKLEVSIKSPDCTSTIAFNANP